MIVRLSNGVWVKSSAAEMKRFPAKDPLSERLGDIRHDHSLYRVIMPELYRSYIDARERVWALEEQILHNADLPE